MEKKKTNRSTPVVEKKVCDCQNGGECTCGPECNCGCKTKSMVFSALKYGVLLVSAAVISAGATIVWHASQLKPQPIIVRYEKQDIEKEISRYIRSNPKALIDSVDSYYKKLEQKANAQPPKEFKLEDLQEAPADIVKKIVEDKTNYSLGNPKGKFVIIEFFDHQCGWCKRTNKAMEEALKQADAKNIRWIPIDTPIFGEKSETIARYVLAAGAQGKYAEMHHAVTNAEGALDEAALIELGKGLKLDTKKLKADANGEKIKAKLESNKEFTKALKIGGVPMLIVDGRINPGALINERLEVVVKAAAKK